MKIVVIGGSGLIGSKVVQLLRAHGHEAVAASPASGVDTVTGAGLAEVLSGNAPSFDGDTVRLAHVFIQPMAADDVASAVAGIAPGAPVKGAIEVAGPERHRLDAFIERGLGARNDPRKVVAEPQARRPASRTGSANRHAETKGVAHEHHQDEGRHRHLLQGLGRGTARRHESRLATQRRCLG